MINKKVKLTILGLILVLIVGCSSSNDGSAEKKENDEENINITFAEPARILSMAPYYVAIELGYFEEEGIEADISSGGGGSQVAASLLSGEAQFAVSGPRSMLTPVEKGEDLVAIQALNSALTFDIALSNEYMEEKGVSPDDPLEDRLEALEGATMGTNNVGDSGDVYVRYLMKKYGKDFESIEMVKLAGNGPKIGGMQDGLVDGGVASAPFAQQAKEQDVGELFIKSSEDEMYANLLWEVVFAKREYLEENPDVAEKVVRAIGKGIEFTRENPGEAAEAVLSYFDGVDVAVLEQSLTDLKDTFQGYGEMDQEAWDNAQDPLVEFGDMSGVETKHDTTPDVLWTNKYIEDAF